MAVIRLLAPVVDGHVASFAWTVDPTTTLYHENRFELRFPDTVDLDRVPRGLWWRIALICLHSQWPLLRPCQVVLPVRLDPGEAEFWLRMLDAEVATLEAWAGREDTARGIELVESGPHAPLQNETTPDAALAVNCFSGGRDSLTQTALLQELGLTPLLVTTSSPREGSIEHATDRHQFVLSEIQRRRGVELVEVESTLRSSWNLAFAGGGYPIAVSEIGDTFLFFAAALVVAAARGAGAVYLASEAEVQENARRGGQIVQFKHFMYSGATQRALSALTESLGIRYLGLTYALRQFQVQRLLGERYSDLRDLQYSCWSMVGGESACSRCGECRHNGFNLMAEGVDPAEIGIDTIALLRASAEWLPRVEADPTLPDVRRLFNAQMLRCLQMVTPEDAGRFIPESVRGTATAREALEGFARMRSRALDYGVESEPGYRAAYLSLVDESLRARLEAILDEHFTPDDDELHIAGLERTLALSDWIAAPLRKPSLAWRALRRPLDRAPRRGVSPTPPDPVMPATADLIPLGPLLPGPEPALASNGAPALRVAETLLDGNELKYVTECVETNWVSSAGSFVGRFEAAFAEASGCRFAVSCTSGTTALHLALAAAGIGPGDEVILPTFTMIASPNAVGYVGATPVLVDTDPNTWNLDLDLVRDRIGPRTRAIMIMHTYGHPVDADAVRGLARENGLAVIEDAAEAHGASLRGRRTGSLGSVAAFSFYGNKIVTTGEGGMVTTNDETIASVARELRDHGFSAERHFWHRFRAFNFRMSNLQAAVGLAQVERLEELLERRRSTARLYRAALAEIPGIELPPTEPGFDDANWMFGCLVDDEFGIGRDELRGRLAVDGIETRTFFVPIHVQPSYGDWFRGRRFPVAERLGTTGLYLPSGPSMDEAKVTRVAESVARARSRSAFSTPRSRT